MTSGGQDNSANSANSAVSAAAAAVAVAAAAAAAAGTPISNSTHWSTEETKLLIKTWGDHRDEFAEIKRNLSVWNKVLERLLTAGFFRTVEQCRNRWKFLETKYRTAFRELDEKGRTTWEFFEDMEMAKRGVESPQPGDSRQSKRYALDASPASQKARRLSPMSAAEHTPPLFTDSHGRVHLPPIHASSNTVFSHAQNQREPSPQPPPPHMHPAYRPHQQSLPLPPQPHHQQHHHSQQSQQIGRHMTSMPAAPPQPTNRHLHPYPHAPRALPVHSTPPSRSVPAAALRTSYVPQLQPQPHRHVRTSSADDMRPEYAHDPYTPQPSLRNLHPDEVYAARPVRQHSDASALASGDDASRDYSGARKRSRPMHRNSLPSTDRLLDDSAMPVLPPGIDRVELTGTVRRTDLLEFLRELSKLREQREAVRIEERKRYEELCSTEEWRFHEFQMSLVNMAQSSLAPHAVDSDDGKEEAASPCALLSQRRISSPKDSASGGGDSTIPYVAEPVEDLIRNQPHPTDSGHDSTRLYSASGASEEGEVVDERGASANRQQMRTPSSSFSTAHMSAAIARAGTRSSLRRVGSSDAEMESSTTNRHISSTSSSPLEIRPTKA
ncbi:hypothetical protein EV175_001020 [Coemansia sp. RSA 1933]|nr:hypothetical protein EV175_001020 [Coemansia sp. RSA 1933]